MKDYSFNRRVKPMTVPTNESAGKALVAVIAWALFAALLLILN